VNLRLSGGRRLQSPPGAIARPTAARVRQAVINLLAMELPGCRWLDLCCGSGVMACEALQRGASRVVAVERDRRIAAVARANLAAVAGGLRQNPAPSIAVVQAEVLAWLGQARPEGGDGLLGAASDPGGRFDLIYADPPWPDDLHSAIAIAVARGQWLSAGGTLVWECPSERVPPPPSGWKLRDSRRYGGSTVVLLEAD
jgi:16S rRNA (guanine(966)-N(2))-methyltransferase RsmD